MRSLDKPDLIRIINEAQTFGISDTQLAYEFIDQFTKVMDVSKILGRIVDNQKAVLEKKNHRLYKGLDMSTQMLGSITQDLMENKTANKGRNTVRFFMNENLSWLTYVMHALHPKGNAEGDHAVGRYLFNWFVKSFKAKERSIDWEKSVGVHEYCNLVVKENPDIYD